MRTDGRALTESLLLHGLLVGSMILMVGVSTTPPKTIRLDFSMLEQTVAPEPKVEYEHKVPEILSPSPRPEPVQEKIKALSKKQIKSIKTKSLSAAEPVPKAAPSETVASPARFTEATKSVSAAADQTNHNQVREESVAESPVISPAEQYRSTNFNAIRDSILANLRYPRIARRNGWSGKVEVAFTISPDGSVNELRILMSSGYPMLDEQVFEAIRRSAPFTPPRVATLLVMPVAFQLN